MREIDFDGLNSTIQDFEKTVGALERIEEMGVQASVAVNNIEKLCTSVENASIRASNDTQEIKETVTNFETAFSEASNRLLSIKGDIEAIVERSAESTSQQMEAIRSDNEAGFNRISDKLTSDGTETRTAIDAGVLSVNSSIATAEKRIEDTLKKIQAMQQDIDEIKKQNVENKKTAILGGIAAGIAMIASIIGLFI